MAAYQRQGNASPSRVYTTSVEVAELVQDTRARVADFLGGDPGGIVYGLNSTSLTWHFARAFERTLEPGDVIVCTQLDHDANVAPWLAIAERTGAEVRFVTLDPSTYELDPRSLERAVDDRTKLIAFTRASNLIGTTVDPRPFVEAARATGAVTYADGVAAAAHFPLRQSEWGIDVQICSPYKFFGPHMGVLSARPELLERLTPDRIRPAPPAGPRRWETGMPSFECIAGLAAVLRYLGEVGFEEIQRVERVLRERALQAIENTPAIRLHGKRTVEGREATFAMSVGSVPPQEVSKRLSAMGVFVSSGHNNAVETVGALGVPQSEGLVRAGFVHYHSVEDVDRTFEALAAVADE